MYVLTGLVIVCSETSKIYTMYQLSFRIVVQIEASILEQFKSLIVEGLMLI